jgi:translation elongation factor EF-1alpha
MLVKTAGVRYLAVLINKIDDPTVNWDQGRYDEIRDKLSPYLKKCGFKPGEDTVFMPCSGMSGAFLKEHSEDQNLLNIWTVYLHSIEVSMVHFECRSSKDTKFVYMIVWIDDLMICYLGNGCNRDG